MGAVQDENRREGARTVRAGDSTKHRTTAGTGDPDPFNAHYAYSRRRRGRSDKGRGLFGRTSSQWAEGREKRRVKRDAATGLQEIL